MLAQHKPLQLLSDLSANCGELPQTAQSYSNFMTEGSALSEVLPLRNGSNLDNFRKITVPILGVIGDQNEYTVIPSADAIKLLRSENKLATVYQIGDCPHGYEGKEPELAVIISRFIQEKASNR